MRAPVSWIRELVTLPPDVTGREIAERITAAGLEVEAGREAEPAMGGPRVAVDASVLAATVGVDRLLEAQIGRVVARDGAARRLQGDLGRRRTRLGLLGVALPVFAQALPALKSVGDSVCTTSTFDGVGHTVIIYSIRIIASAMPGIFT